MCPPPMTSDKPRPDLVAVARNADHYLLQCMICGDSARIELPVLGAELQRLYDEFAGKHGHGSEPRPVSDSTSKPGELAPCPFCGSKRLALVHWYELPNHSAVRCRDCLSQGPPAFPKEVAWEMWSRQVKANSGRF